MALLSAVTSMLWTSWSFRLSRSCRIWNDISYATWSARYTWPAHSTHVMSFFSLFLELSWFLTLLLLRYIYAIPPDRRLHSAQGSEGPGKSMKNNDNKINRFTDSPVKTFSRFAVGHVRIWQSREKNYFLPKFRAKKRTKKWWCELAANFPISPHCMYVTRPQIPDVYYSYSAFLLHMSFSNIHQTTHSHT